MDEDEPIPAIHGSTHLLYGCLLTSEDSIHNFNTITLVHHAAPFLRRFATNKSIRCTSSSEYVAGNGPVATWSTLRSILNFHPAFLPQYSGLSASYSARSVSTIALFTIFSPPGDAETVCVGEEVFWRGEMLAGFSEVFRCTGASTMRSPSSSSGANCVP